VRNLWPPKRSLAALEMTSLDRKFLAALGMTSLDRRFLAALGMTLRGGSVFRLSPLVSRISVLRFT